MAEWIEIRPQIFSFVYDTIEIVTFTVTKDNQVFIYSDFIDQEYFQNIFMFNDYTLFDIKKEITAVMLNYFENKNKSLLDQLQISKDIMKILKKELYTV